MLKTEKIKYRDGDIELEGYVAFNKNSNESKPAVLVFHDWSGRNEFAIKKAEQLAALGYIGFAVDMYGVGKVGTTKEEKTALMQPLFENRDLVKARALAALRTVQQLPNVDVKRIAAIGFCFGGLCALDLARAGAEIKGVVSFHGLLLPPAKLENTQIHAKVLVLHGNDDPLVPVDQVLAFEREMSEAKVDWQIHIFGGTHHAFSNPAAHDVEMGLIYDEKAEKRSWIGMKSFFEEIL